MNPNPFQPPLSRIEDISHADYEISVSELAAFAGNEEYPRSWKLHQDQKTRLAGFNGWACLLGIQWFFFRKLYLQGLFSLVLEVGVPFLIVVAVGSSLDSETLSLSSRELAYGLLVAAIGTRVAIGYWANLALFRRAAKEIRAVDSLNLDNDAHLKELAKRGGVSFPSVFALYVAFGVLRVIFEGAR